MVGWGKGLKKVCNLSKGKVRVMTTQEVFFHFLHRKHFGSICAGHPPSPPLPPSSRLPSCVNLGRVSVCLCRASSVDVRQITLGVYAGWYSVRDEAFYTEAELVDGKAPSGVTVRDRLHTYITHIILFHMMSTTKLPSLRLALVSIRSGIFFCQMKHRDFFDAALNAPFFLALFFQPLGRRGGRVGGKGAVVLLQAERVAAALAGILREKSWIHCSRVTEK